MEIMYKAHGDQMYGDKPYVWHILDVASAFRVLFGEPTTHEEILILLHDVVEDTDLTIEDLERERFETSILAAEDAITKREGETRAEYIARCKHNAMARRVKIADTYANLTASLKEGHVKRITKYTKQLAALYKGDLGELMVSQE
jgi:(p)ppGpp synthase/HD superfamily hydrolase